MKTSSKTLQKKAVFTIASLSVLLAQTLPVGAQVAGGAWSAPVHGGARGSVRVSGAGASSIGSYAPNLDFASSSATVHASQSGSVILGGTVGANGLISGGTSISVLLGQFVTPAVNAALWQASNGGQRLLLSDTGSGIGGTAKLTNSWSSSLAALVIPKGVSVNAIGFNTAHPLSVFGSSNISGSFYSVQTAPGLTSVLNFGNDLTIGSGGVLSGSLPASLAQSGLHSSQNLSVIVGGNFSNSGSVSVPGTLNLQVAGSLANLSSTNSLATISAQNINIISGNGLITNSGLISATNALNINTQGNFTNLEIDNTGGTLRAIGKLNIRNNNVIEAANAGVWGGMLEATAINMFGKNMILNVDQINGIVNNKGSEAHLFVNSGTLNVGDQILSGDPNYFNTTGDVNLTSGSYAVAGDMAVVAAGNITSSGAVSLKPASNGSVSLIAGFTFTVDSGASKINWASNQGLANTITFDGNVTGTPANIGDGTNAITITTTGGGAVTIASTGSTNLGTGKITTATGNVVAITGGNFTTTGTITTTGGSVSIASATPAIAMGVTSTGGTLSALPTAGAASTGTISTAAISASKGISISTGNGSISTGALTNGSTTLTPISLSVTGAGGGSITTGAITNQNTTGTNSVGNSVSITDASNSTGAISTGAIDTRGRTSIGSSGGAITVILSNASNTGSIATGSLSSGGIGSATLDASGGNITVNAGSTNSASVSVGGAVNSAGYRASNSGDITLSSKGDLTVTGGINSSVLNLTTGNAGTVSLSSNSSNQLQINNGTGSPSQINGNIQDAGAIGSGGISVTNSGTGGVLINGTGSTSTTTGLYTTGGVTIASPNGALALNGSGQAAQTTGTAVAMSVSAAGVNVGTSGGGRLITAGGTDSIAITSTGAIGSSTNPVTLSAPTLSSSSSTDTYVNNSSTATVTVTSANAGGFLSLSNTGTNTSMVLAGDVTGTSGVTLATKAGTGTITLTDTKTISATNNPITITAQNFILGNDPSSTAKIDAGNGTVSLRPNNSQTVEIGGPGTTGVFKVTDNVLANVTAGTLQIGAATLTGAVTQASGSTLNSSAYNVIINSPSTYTGTGSTTSTGAKDFTVNVSSTLNAGTISSTSGNISLSTVTNLNLNGDLSTGGAGNISINVSTGKITGNSKTISASAGTITINSLTGTIASIGAINSDGNVVIGNSTGTGTLAVGSTIDTTGAVTILNKTGNLSIGGAIGGTKAPSSVYIETTGTGTVGTKAITSTGNVSVLSTTGTLTTGGAISTTNGVDNSLTLPMSISLPASLPTLNPGTSVVTISASNGTVSLGGNVSNAGASNKSGGEIIISGTTITSAALRTVTANGNGNGDGGVISLRATAGGINLTSAAGTNRVSVSANGGNTSGNGGFVSVAVGGANTITVGTTAGVNANPTSTNGNGGQIYLYSASGNGGTISVTTAANVAADGAGSGRGGAVGLSADNINILGISAVTANGANGGTGSGGAVSVNQTGSGVFAPGSSVTISASGSSSSVNPSLNGGSVAITAASINWTGLTGQIQASAGSSASSGNGGSITISTNGNLTLASSGLSVNSATAGSGGTITVQNLSTSSGNILIGGSLSATGAGALEQAGSITITNSNSTHVAGDGTIQVNGSITSTGSGGATNGSVTIAESVNTSALTIDSGVGANNIQNTVAAGTVSIQNLGTGGIATGNISSPSISAISLTLQSSGAIGSLATNVSTNAQNLNAVSTNSDVFITDSFNGTVSAHGSASSTSGTGTFNLTNTGTNGSLTLDDNVYGRGGVTLNVAPNKTLTINANKTVSSTGTANINLKADAIVFGSGSSVDAGASGSITVFPATASKSLTISDLGTGYLTTTGGKLTQFVANRVTFGNNSVTQPMTGNWFISSGGLDTSFAAAGSQPGAFNVFFKTSGNYDSLSGDVNFGPNTFNVTVGGVASIGNLTGTTSSLTITGGTGIFQNGNISLPNGTVSLNSPTFLTGGGSVTANRLNLNSTGNATITIDGSGGMFGGYVVTSGYLQSLSVPNVTIGGTGATLNVVGNINVSTSTTRLTLSSSIFDSSAGTIILPSNGILTVVTTSGTIGAITQGTTISITGTGAINLVGAINAPSAVVTVNSTGLSSTNGASVIANRVNLINTSAGTTNVGTGGAYTISSNLLNAITTSRLAINASNISVNQAIVVPSTLPNITFSSTGTYTASDAITLPNGGVLTILANSADLGAINGGTTIGVNTSGMVNFNGNVNSPSATLTVTSGGVGAAMGVTVAANRVNLIAAAGVTSATIGSGAGYVVSESFLQGITATSVSVNSGSAPMTVNQNIDLHTSSFGSLTLSTSGAYNSDGFDISLAPNMRIVVNGGTILTGGILGGAQANLNAAGLLQYHPGTLTSKVVVLNGNPVQPIGFEEKITVSMTRSASSKTIFGGMEIWQSDDAEIVKDSDSNAQLLNGEAIFSAQKDVVIKTQSGEINVAKGSVVQLKQLGTVLIVRTLHNSHKSAVSFASKLGNVHINPGEQFIVGMNKRDVQSISQTENVANRGRLGASLGEVESERSEYSLVSLVNSSKLVASIFKSKGKSERELSKLVIRTAASVNAITSSHGSYKI